MLGAELVVPVSINLQHFDTMRSALGSRQNFQMWKWRALHKRRLFFINLLQLILVFVWLRIFLDLQGGFYLFSDAYQSGSYGSDFSSIPGVLFLFHSVLFIGILTSRQVRERLNETQGRKICEGSILSLFAALVFLLNPNEIFEKRLDSLSSSANFAMLTVFGLSVCQFVGLNETATTLTRLVVVGLWGLFFYTKV